LALAVGAIPASWGIGDGKYGLLLGVNAWGFVLCTSGFFAPLLVARWRRQPLAVSSS